jgi:Cu-Zn family superoxide dismutase
VGDLPNLKVNASGGGSLTFLIPGATLGDGANSLFHDGGTALVIHAKADDLSSDPSGNSGDRVACGVISK